MWGSPLKKKESFLLFELSLSESAETLFSLAFEDVALNIIIDELLVKLESENIECFKRINNIIATEKGYFAAFYEGDVRLKKPNAG